MESGKGNVWSSCVWSRTTRPAKCAFSFMPSRGLLSSLTSLSTLDIHKEAWDHKSVKITVAADDGDGLETWRLITKGSARALADVLEEHKMANATRDGAPVELDGFFLFSPYAIDCLSGLIYTYICRKTPPLSSHPACSFFNQQVHHNNLLHSNFVFVQSVHSDINSVLKGGRMGCSRINLHRSLLCFFRSSPRIMIGQEDFREILPDYIYSITSTLIKDGHPLGVSLRLPRLE